ncbi:MAG: HEPN domain-containing protein [Bosea sp.]|jgi:HEPN domain-containing protein|nr:HEPN domain-containing protein [Bosea sp. (in: a-proteobacteria)]
MDEKSLKRRRVEAFMALASRDMESARLLNAAQPESAAFHVQQAVEKLLRAVLEWEGVLASNTHNIAALSAILPEGHDFRETFYGFGELSRSATLYRYPTSSARLPTVEAKTVAQQLMQVEQLQTSVAAWLAPRLK